MIENNINSSQMINRGLSKARKPGSSPFLPNPGDFCAWCLPAPEDYGIPALEAAFNDARNQSGKSAEYRHWLHEIVFFSAADTGFFDLRSVGNNDSNFKSLKSRFADIYKSYCDRVISGEQFSLPEGFRLTRQPVDYKNPRHKMAGEKTINSLKGMFDLN